MTVLAVEALEPDARVLLDTNAVIRGMTHRSSPLLARFFKRFETVFLSGPVLAEVTWALGRLDPAHPNTPTVLAAYSAVLARIGDNRILVPNSDEWAAAGELAGRAARALSGPRVTRSAEGRAALLADAITAVVAIREAAVVVTADSHFETLERLDPRLSLAMYDIPQR